MKSGELIPTLYRLPILPILGRRGGGGVSDPDAQSYITRSGVSDPDNRETINDLVIELKSASLWTPLSVAWIGRSGFNAGTGTTVYDMKSNTNNGTLSGAGWSADGLTFTNTQYMSSAYMHDISSLTNAWSAYMVFKVASDTSVNGRLFGAAAGATSTMMFMVDANKAATRLGVYDTSQAYNGFVNANLTVFIRIAIRCLPSGHVGGPLTQWYQNGSTTPYTAISNCANGASYALYLNHPDSLAGHGTKTIAFAAMQYGTNWSANDLAAMDTAVMGTICSGL